MVAESERREGLFPIPLKELIVPATLSSSVAIPHGVPAIDLENLGREAEALLDETLEDPQKMEVGKIVLVTRQGKVLISIQSTRGQETDTGQQIRMAVPVHQTSTSRLLPRRLRQKYFPATVIHSHGVEDLPPSPNDLAPLLRTEFHPGIDLLAFVITARRKVLVFRGEDTPQWDERRVEEKRKAWNQMVLARIHANLHPHMTHAEQVEINVRAQNAFLRDVSRKYGFQVFTCLSRENIAFPEQFVASSRNGMG